MKQPPTPDEFLQLHHEAAIHVTRDNWTANQAINHEIEAMYHTYAALYRQYSALREAIQQIADRGGISADDYEKKYKGDKLRHYSSMIAKRALQGES